MFSDAPPLPMSARRERMSGHRTASDVKTWAAVNGKEINGANGRWHDQRTLPNQCRASRV